MLLDESFQDEGGRISFLIFLENFTGGCPCQIRSDWLNIVLVE